MNRGVCRIKDERGRERKRNKKKVLLKRNQTQSLEVNQKRMKKVMFVYVSKAATKTQSK